ncbi:hypothetical protein [Bacillus tuaregi]|uniref:hypothetical protein n=1 Tax=Bacillus tuaregi TaxID=1816695 RepID=UPI0008F90C1F|nr:hypothetical protein [Bacillus tuaregi]
MNRFLKLVHFEFQRFFKLYFVLIGMTILLQMIGVVAESKSYVGQLNESIYKDLMPKEQFIDIYGTFSFIQIVHSFWFMAPIALSIAALLMYVFFIWYRDWFGKNTFAYRLFMLPTSRLNIYLAKAAVIFLFIIGLLSVQLLLLPLENQMLKGLIPNEFLTLLSFNSITNIDYLTMLFPPSFMEFILYYGGGMTALFIVFTAILFERSYRIKGIFYGILYCAVSLFIFLAPLLTDTFILKNYFYPMELFFMELVTGLIVLAGAIWIGHYLLKNKVRV